MNRVEDILIGICFGLWPFIMNKSGLDSRFTPVLTYSVPLLIALIRLYMSNSRLVGINNKAIAIGFISALVCAIGVLKFFDLLNKSQKDLSISFIIITLIQVSIPVLINIVVSGELTLNKTVGFLCVFLSIYFLNK